MVRLESADFLVGRRQSRLREQDSHLEKLRQVRIDGPFYIAATETTRAQYAAHMKAKGAAPTLDRVENIVGEKSGGDLPVNYVSWEDAVSFCKWLSDVENRRYRLPTCAEWEYACYACDRSASGTEKLTPLGDYAWYRGNAGRNGVHPVASKRPNDVGLFDMLGNVWEWCADIVPASVVDGTPPFKGRVCAFCRGGAYFNSEESCNCSSAYAFNPIDYRAEGLGFRVVCEGY